MTNNVQTFMRALEPMLALHRRVWLTAPKETIRDIYDPLSGSIEAHVPLQAITWDGNADCRSSMSIAVDQAAM